MPHPASVARAFRHNNIERRKGRSPLTPADSGEVTILDEGGGVITDTLQRAGSAVIRGAKVIDVSGNPVAPVEMVICRKVVTRFESKAILRKAGMKVQLIDAGGAAYIAPWATEDQPLIAKGNCRALGACAVRDFEEGCGYCNNKPRGSH